MSPSRRKFVKQFLAISSGAIWAPMLPGILRASPGSADIPAGDESVCPKPSTPAKTLWALRMGDLKKGPEERLPISCLQGLVNREQPQIYLAYDNFDEKWLDWLRERGDVNEVHWVGRKELVEKFLPIVKNVVIIDPEVHGTINVATMLCAVEGWLPVTPEMAAEIEHLKVAMDLRGKWKKNIDAYRWFFSKYGTQMSRKVCANYDPGQFELRDYFVEFKVPIVWVSSPKDAKVSKTASPEEEAQFTRELFLSMPANIPCMGWWDNGQAGEFGTGENGTTSGIDLASETGKFEVCTGFDGYAHGVANLSVHSGTKATFRQKPAPPAPVLEDKVYVAFTRTDGDGPNFYRQVYRDLWDQPDHGKVPVGWQLGPTASDLMPDILDYFYQHATPNDVFVNALTGVGYLHEAVFLDKWPESEREAAWQQYMDLSERYFKRLDLSLLTTFEVDKLMSPETLDRFTQLPGLRGIYRNYHRFTDTTVENETTEVNGIPIFRAVCSQGYSVAPARFERSVQGVVREIKKYTPAKRPAFLHVSFANWMVDMSVLVAIEKALGPDYVTVRADHLPALYMQAKKQTG